MNRLMTFAVTSSRVGAGAWSPAPGASLKALTDAHLAREWKRDGRAVMQGGPVPD